MLSAQERLLPLLLLLLLPLLLRSADLLPPEKQERYVKKAQKMVAHTLANTKFAGAPQVAVAARPAAAAAAAGAPEVGGEEAAGPGGGGSSGGAGAAPLGVAALVEVLLSRVRLRPAPAPGAPFLFFVDHCFAVKGQGTVLTGGWWCYEIQWFRHDLLQVWGPMGCSGVGWVVGCHGIK